MGQQPGVLLYTEQFLLWRMGLLYFSENELAELP